jgi:hypothetical protein
LDRNGGFMVNQAGIVIDADVAPNLSFWYDLDAIREGVARDNTFFPVQQVYARVDNVLDQSWLNVKLGRAFMPFGEEYLQWDSIDNPLGSFSTAVPWAQDEGIVFFGDLLPNNKLSYAASVQNGNSTFNFDDNSNKTAAARLTSQLLPWLHVSGSYLNLGKQGNNTVKGTSEFWLSGMHIQPLGATTAAGGASPSNMVAGQALEGDVVISDPHLGRIWANYGYLSTQDGGGGVFNRIIRWYTGEILGYVPSTKEKAYVVGRYSAIGTFNPNLGYRFAGTELANNVLGNNSSPYAALNYNQRDLYRWSLGVGYKFTENVVWKAEYSWEDTHLIDSAKTSANLSFVGQHNFYLTELGFRF